MRAGQPPEKVLPQDVKAASSNVRLQTESGPLPRPVGERRYLLCLIPMLVALVEIQFAEPSWHFFYPFIRYTLGLESYYANMNHLPGEATITAILVTIMIFRPDYRKTVVPYLIALLVASTVVTAMKFVTGRARPEPYGVRQEAGEFQEVREYLAVHPNAILRPEPGDYWLWLSPHRPGLEFLGWFTGDREFGDRREDLSTGDFSSFPSGHATSAFLLAAYLSILFPKGRWLWYILAIGTACARIRFKMHYPGDVIFGGALGWITLHVIFSMQWPFRLGIWAEDKVTGVITAVGSWVGWRSDPTSQRA